MAIEDLARVDAASLRGFATLEIARASVAMRAVALRFSIADVAAAERPTARAAWPRLARRRAA
jgi:hypothetical protein